MVNLVLHTTLYAAAVASLWALLCDPHGWPWFYAAQYTTSLWHTADDTTRHPSGNATMLVMECFVWFFLIARGLEQAIMMTGALGKRMKRKVFGSVETEPVKSINMQDLFSWGGLDVIMMLIVIVILYMRVRLWLEPDSAERAWARTPDDLAYDASNLEGPRR